jgi:K+-transporting ATPase ATPase C chain
MRTHLLRSLVLTAVLVVLVGVVYPLASWGIGQLAFHEQANGSIVANGSSLIGQPWNNGSSIDPMWFNGRPDPDNPLELNGTPGSSGAANLGPRSEVLVSTVQTIAAEWRAVGVTPTPDLVTSSGSGLDPDLSPLDAMVQVHMVATARHLPIAAVRALVTAHTHGAQFGFLGASYVNLLELNTALAALAGRHG